MMIGKPGLILDSFAPIGLEEAADRIRDHVRLLWDLCASIGMTEPIPGFPIDDPDLPTEDIPRYEILAGRRSPSRTETFEAITYARHDVVGVRVALASNRTDERIERWSSFFEQLRSAGGLSELPAGLLGECLTFFGTTETASRDPDSYFDDIQEALDGCGLRCWDRAFPAAGGRVIWEGPPSDGRRVLVALGVQRQEPSFDAWIWWPGESDLARHALYLLHATKLQYETGVFALRRADLKRAMHDLDARIDHVLSLHEHVKATGRGALTSLLAAQQELIQEQAHSSGLVIQISHLRALQQTVAIARDNLETFSAPEDPPSDAEGLADTPFGRDSTLGYWLASQVEQDIGYAEAVNERALEAQALTSLQLEAAAEERGRVGERIDLLQTTLLGALISGLTIVTTFGLQFTPRSELQLPLFVTVVSLLVAIPPLAAHWHERYRLADRLAAMALGAASFWLATVLAFGAVNWPLGISVGIAGALVTLAVSYAHDRVGPRAGRPDRYPPP